MGDRFIRKYYKIFLGSPLLAQNGNAMSDGGVSAPGAAGGARSPTTHRTFLRAASSRVVLALRPRVGSDAFALQPPWKARLHRPPEPARTGNRPPRLHPDADSPRDFTCRWDTVPGNRGTPPPPPELAGDGARRARRQRALGMGRPGCPCHARNPGRMRTGLARPRLPPAQGTIVTCPAPHPPLVSTVRGRQGRRPRAWPT